MTTGVAGQPTLIRAAVKLAIGIVTLLLIHTVVANLSLLNQPIPFSGIYITYTALGKAAIQTVMFVLLIRFGTEIRPAAESAFPTAPEIGRILQLAIWFVPVVLAYSAYSEIAEAIFGMTMWLYRLVFVLLAGSLLVATGVLVFRNLEPLTDLAVHIFRRPTPSPTASAYPGCPSCGATMSASALFCSSCGKAVGTLAQVPVEPIAHRRCPKCQAEVLATQRFCRSCGSELQSS